MARVPLPAQFRNGGWSSTAARWFSTAPAPTPAAQRFPADVAARRRRQQWCDRGRRRQCRHGRFDRADDITFGGMISGTGRFPNWGAEPSPSREPKPIRVQPRSRGTLALSSSGSIVNSNSVATYGNFDISATAGIFHQVVSGSWQCATWGQP